MALARGLAYIGFAFGFVGSVAFYAVGYQSHLLCPLCPYVTTIGSRLQIGLTYGLFQGLTFGLLGSIFGWVILRVSKSS
jgi:hypothetical protein